MARDFDDAASMSGSVKSGVSRSSRASSSKTSRSKRGTKKPPAGPKEPPPKPQCSIDTIRAGLSQLGRTADGLRPAYLKLQVDGTDMATADLVEAYMHLQTLLLRNNELTSLKALGRLDSLTHLDVSGNRLRDVLGYTPPTPTPGHDVILRFADFSNNLITSIDDLASFPRLLTLRLDNNQIERVCGLRGQQMLQRLSLSGNRLLSCLGLEGLASLQELDLTNNCLVNLEPLASLRNLEVLLVARNQLSSLRGLEGLTSLRKLDVSSNQLESLQELAGVAHAAQLCDLLTTGNPWDRLMGVRLHIIHLLPQVTLLNTSPVAAKEKVLSVNIHGADAEGLREIRRRFFPNGELDDGGGAIPPAAAGLLPCRAEEERIEGLEAEFLRMDAWAKAMAPGCDAPWWRAAVAAADVARAAMAAAAAARPLPMTTSNVSRMAALVEDVGGASSSGAAGPAVAVAAAAPLVTLADQLASVAGGSQALLARVCWQWVACNTRPPRREHTWSVHAPLFGAGPVAETAELALLGAPGVCAGDDDGDEADAVPAGGAWAERAAWLFVHLARACELEARLIPGYWKNGVLDPGARLDSHNHCWSGVKVNGRWRLVDCTAAALGGGGAPAAPFFTPPEAFIYSYMPLAAEWQLLNEPVSLDAWWAMPECSVAFFSRGCKLLSPELRSVNVLPSYREGETLPHLLLSVSQPHAPGARLTHAVVDAATRRVVAAWPAAEPRPLAPQLAFQQVSHDAGSHPIVEFGPRSFTTQATQMYASFPGPGEYFVEVQHILDIPGGLQVHVKELGTALSLRIVQSDDVLRIKVVVPEPEPHDPEDGVLHDLTNPPCLLPYTYDRFILSRCQLASPPPPRQLEADREEVLEVVAPGASRVALATADGKIIAELPQVEDDTGPSRFRKSLQVPRVSSLQVLGYLHRSDLGVCGWQPLLALQVLPQTQHIVELPEEYDVPDMEEDDPAAALALEMFHGMDLNQDGRVTRREMLVAFRHNRQHADHLKIPARLHLHDGSFDRFVDTFLKIDHSKLGSFTFSELCSYMGVEPTEWTDDEDEDNLSQELDGVDAAPIGDLDGVLGESAYGEGADEVDEAVVPDRVPTPLTVQT